MMWDTNKVYAFVFLPLLIAVGLFFFMKHPTDTRSETVIRIGDREWRAEVAATGATRAKGLSDRDSICPDCAMLFRFGTEGSYGFWMKGMLFPIDIAWIRSGTIVHIERDVPKDFRGVMTPEPPADTVLETNAGDLRDVSVGAEVSIR